MDQNQNTLAPQGGSVGKNNSSLIVVGGIAAVIVLLGIAWYMMRMNQDGAAMPAQNGIAQTEATPTEDAATTALSTQGSSDEVGAIDADIKATDMTSLNDVNTL